VTVERDTALVGLEEHSDRVVARLQRADGGSEECEAAFLAACDGAHSSVRQTLSIGFAGGTYEHLFYVADVEADGPAVNGDIHVALDRTDFLAVFPLKDPHRARLVGTVRDHPSRDAEDHLTWNDVGRRVIEWMRIEIKQVHWFSTYRVHHRVADRFRHGRAFLLGDAAHIHSPVGGQGMNTGIGDAVNLAWKLAAVLQGRATATLLDTYEPERITFAQRLVATTDRVFTAVTSSGAGARLLRLRVAPRLLPRLVRFAAVRRLMFRTVSQTAIAYRHSAISDGHAGGVHGGDRLPWVPLGPPGDGDNFAPLTSLDWQVHVYGNAQHDIRTVCANRQLLLHEFPWQPAAARAGLQRDAVYLVRPDGHVALASMPQSAAALERYLDAWSIRF
jgi:hypothetical protein